MTDDAPRGLSIVGCKFIDNTTAGYTDRRREEGGAMRRFRKKPLLIEADQFWPEKHPWPEGVICHPVHGVSQPIIRTLEGPHTVSPGDWIITGIKGERYPCKPDIFEATYDEVSDE